MNTPTTPPPGQPDPADLLALGLATEAGAADSSSPPPSPADLTPEFPQLELLELIGRGGMGAVYKARQRDLDRLVALKILRPGLDADPGFAERFTREARSLAQLNHPGIVTLYEFGKTISGRYFILMEFVDGVNLRQLLTAGRLSPREALAIVPPLCDALQYAHDRGIIHRDIKPENILVDRLGRVKIADFGIARLAAKSSDERQQVEPKAVPDDTLTSAGGVMGTPAYMAPEQRTTPDQIDHRADLYALGVVLYQMLTGELPAAGQLRPPSTRVQLDVRLDEIVLRALEKDPALRYAAASEFKTQLETVTQTPASAPSVTHPTVQVKSSHYRLRFRFALAGLCAVVLCALFFAAKNSTPPSPPPPKPTSQQHFAPSPTDTKRPPAAEDLSLKVASGELVLKALAWQDEIEAGTGKPWSPSGTPIPDSLIVPPSGNMTVLELDGKQHTRILSLSFQQKPYDAQSLLEVVMMDESGNRSVEGANKASSRSSSHQSGDEFGWHSLSLAAGPAETIPERIVLKVRSTFGAWTPLGKIEGNFKNSTAFSDGVFRTAPTEDNEGNSHINLVRNHALNASTEQYGFVAVTKDGRRFASVITEGTTGNGVSTENHKFPVPLNEVIKFECYKRPIHVTTLPITVPPGLTTSSVAHLALTLPAAFDHQSIRLDRAGDTMQAIVQRLRHDHGLRLAFENLDFTPADAVTLGARLRDLGVKETAGTLAGNEAQLLAEARRLRDQQHMPETVVIDVGPRYSGLASGSTVTEFFANLTAGTPYTARKIGATWVIRPRAGSVLDYPSTLDTSGLSVDDAVRAILDQSPAGKPIGSGMVFGMPVAAGTDPTPWLSVHAPALTFNKTSAAEALCRLTEAASPASVWEISGYRDARQLSLAPDPNDKATSVVRAAQTWLVSMDAGDSAVTWRDADVRFRQQITSEAWAAALKTHAETWGKPLARRLIDLQPSLSVGQNAGANGRHVVITFECRFDSKPSVSETISCTQDTDGQWRSASYERRPAPSLIPVPESAKIALQSSFRQLDELVAGRRNPAEILTNPEFTRLNNALASQMARLLRGTVAQPLLDRSALLQTELRAAASSGDQARILNAMNSLKEEDRRLKLMLGVTAREQTRPSSP